MKTKIYIVSYVSFDGSDNNLYTEVKTFTGREKAEAFYRKNCRTALADARREDLCESEDEWAHVIENDMGNTYYVSRFNETYETKVELKEMDLHIPYATDRRRYGMTLKEVRDEIAAFTGSSLAEASRKAEIFSKNCRVPLSRVLEIRLSSEKYIKTLNFEYTDRDGNQYHFSIVE